MYSSFPLFTYICLTCGIPAFSKITFVYALSIHTQDPSTLQPTYGSFNNSNNPCIVPSSPYSPCNTGKTTSTDFNFCNTFSILEISVGSSPTFKISIVSIFLSYENHSPFLSIYIGMISYLSLFKFFITDVPETTETSCSVDIPPKITPIFNLFIKSHPFKNQFLLIVF